MEKKYVLECCVDSVESALFAVAGGADRLELCSNLVIGGTTPSVALFREIRKHTSIPIHVLIRPRFGDFLYTEHEANIICEEISAFRDAGAEGVVIGSLCPDGSLNLEHMARFISLAKGMTVTLHRAFDMCAEPSQTLRQAKELGVDIILTSGQAACCVDKMSLLCDLCEAAGGNIAIMAGGGVSAATVPMLLSQTPLTNFHMSGKKVLQSGMHYRNSSVSMGLPGLSEYEIWQTDEVAVRCVREILDAACNRSVQ